MKPPQGSDLRGRFWVDGYRRWLLPTVSPLVASVPAVREQVCGVLSWWRVPGTCQDVALVLVNELVTNAVQHARTLFNVTMTWDERRLRCEVTDASPVPPAERPLDPDSLSGRGLVLVHEMSSRSGVDVGERGKTVWFELVAGSVPATR